MFMKNRIASRTPAQISSTVPLRMIQGKLDQRRCGFLGGAASLGVERPDESRYADRAVAISVIEAYRSSIFFSIALRQIASSRRSRNGRMVEGGGGGSVRIWTITQAALPRN